MLWINFQDITWKAKSLSIQIEEMSIRIRRGTSYTQEVTMKAAHTTIGARSSLYEPNGLII